jgi:hypothetical protein
MIVSFFFLVYSKMCAVFVGVWLQKIEMDPVQAKPPKKIMLARALPPPRTPRPPRRAAARRPWTGSS